MFVVDVRGLALLVLVFVVWSLSLFVVRCLLFVVSCLLFVVRCLMLVVRHYSCWWLFVVCCLLCALVVCRCLLLVVCFVVRCSLVSVVVIHVFLVHCSLFVVGCCCRSLLIRVCFAFFEVRGSRCWLFVVGVDGCRCCSLLSIAVSLCVRCGRSLFVVC